MAKENADVVVSVIEYKFDISTGKMTSRVTGETFLKAKIAPRDAVGYSLNSKNFVEFFDKFMPPSANIPKFKTAMKTKMDARTRAFKEPETYFYAYQVSSFLENMYLECIQIKILK